jgi:hypothetical protein
MAPRPCSRAPAFFARPVSVYRLVTTKTYEQEMFSRASVKLGLDTAVMARLAEDKAENELEGAPNNVTDEVRELPQPRPVR